MFDVICVVTFFIIFLLQIMKTIVHRFKPSKNISDSNTSTVTVTHQKPQKSEKIQKIVDKPESLTKIEEEIHLEKPVMQMKKEVQDIIEENLHEDQKKEEKSNQIQAEKNEEKPQQESKSKHNSLKKQISFSSSEIHAQSPKFKSVQASKNSKRFIFDENEDLLNQITDLFTKNSTLEREVFMKSALAKDTIKKTEHDQITTTMQKQITSLTNQLTKTKQQLRQSKLKKVQPKEKRQEKREGKREEKREENTLEIQSLRKERDKLILELSRRKMDMQSSPSIITPEKSTVKEENNELAEINENLKGQLQFCQSQLIQAYQTENQLKEKLQQFSKSSQTGLQMERLKNKVSSMQPIVQSYHVMQKKYFQMKRRLQELGHHPHFKSNISSSSISPRVHEGSQIQNSRVSEASSVSQKRTSTIHYYRFLADCSFTDQNAKEFIYSQLHKVLRGVLKTEILFQSDLSRTENAHEVIDEIKNILLLIELQNGKILGAFSHQAFSPKHQNPKDNFAFIFDISNQKCFPNTDPTNTITYNKDCLVWGFNEIMIKFSEPQIMYTNFCRNHNVFWDKQYRIEQFINSDKQWARINKFQLYKIVKI